MASKKQSQHSNPGLSENKAHAFSLPLLLPPHISGRMADSRAKIWEVNIIFICKKIVYTTEILFSKY